MGRAVGGRIGEVEGQQGFVRTARRINCRVGGFEISRLETAMKTAMKDADLGMASGSC